MGDELRVRLAIEPESRELDPDNEHHAHAVETVCAGLIHVDAQGNMVRLIHYIAQKFLLEALRS